MSWLITPAQLDKFRKNQKSVIILDASWHLPTAGRDAKEEFLERHILGAHFFDLNEFHDSAHPVTNMLIQDEQLISEKLGKAGIRDDYKIIFYDNSELHTSCRALWMMRFFGHNPHQLYILDGGLSAWLKYRGKIASGAVTTTAKKYSARLRPELLRTLSQMKENVKHQTEQMVDVRSAVRFAGGNAESRPNMRSGHIPGSHCFPYTSFFEKDGRFLSLEKIRRLLSDVAIDPTAPTITSCGSGITAAILNVVFEFMNHPQHALYDGSWAEWGSTLLYPGEHSIEERPVETCLENEETES